MNYDKYRMTIATKILNKTLETTEASAIFINIVANEISISDLARIEQSFNEEIKNIHSKKNLQN